MTFSYFTGHCIFLLFSWEHLFSTSNFSTVINGSLEVPGVILFKCPRQWKKVSTKVPIIFSNVFITLGVQNKLKS
jgi:hypothetical protein